MTSSSSPPAEARLLERVAAAERGPAVTAFVEVDGGLLAGCPLAPFVAPTSLWDRFTGQVRAGVAGPDEVTVPDVERVVRSRRA